MDLMPSDIVAQIFIEYILSDFSYINTCTAIIKYSGVCHKWRRIIRNDMNIISIIALRMHLLPSPNLIQDLLSNNIFRYTDEESQFKNHWSHYHIRSSHSAHEILDRNDNVVLTTTTILSVSGDYLAYCHGPDLVIFNKDINTMRRIRSPTTFPLYHMFQTRYVTIESFFESLKSIHQVSCGLVIKLRAQGSEILLLITDDRLIGDNIDDTTAASALFGYDRYIVNDTICHYSCLLGEIKTGDYLMKYNKDHKVCQGNIITFLHSTTEYEIIMYINLERKIKVTKYNRQKEKCAEKEWDGRPVMCNDIVIVMGNGAVVDIVRWQEIKAGAKKVKRCKFSSNRRYYIIN